MLRIRERRIEHVEEYSLNFDYLTIPGAGYSFPCDKAGAVDVGELNVEAQANFHACVSKSFPVGGAYVRDLSRDRVVDELRRCECGGTAWFSRTCGAFVCDACSQHDGLVRCFCGWSASGRDGVRELLELGENLDLD